MPEARLLGNPPVKVKVSINHGKCQHEADEAATTCVCNRPHDYDENQATDLRGTQGLDLWIFYMKHLWELRVGERSYICQSCLLFTRFRKHMPSLLITLKYYKGRNWRPCPLSISLQAMCCKTTSWPIHLPPVSPVSEVILQAPANLFFLESYFPLVTFLSMSPVTLST